MIVIVSVYSADSVEQFLSGMVAPHKCSVVFKRSCQLWAAGSAT